MNRRWEGSAAAVGLLAATLVAATAAASPQAGASTTTALASRIAELEAVVAAQTQQLAALKQDLAALETASDTELAPVSIAGAIEPDTERADRTRHGFLLPSRSWAGGELNYGEHGLALETHGFVDLEYLDAGPDGSRGGVSTFDNHHANLFFDSSFRPNLRGHVELEFEHAGDEVEIDQAFLRWAIDDRLMLQFGRFYTPFGIERFVWYSPTNALVSRPEPFRQIVPGNFYAQGLMALGAFGGDGPVRFTYEAAISDGLGDDAATNRRGSRQTRDNNSRRAWSGRAGVVFWPWLELGASYHGQPYSDDGQLALRFLGLDASARWRGWELRSEFVNARVEQASDTGSGALRAPDLLQDGWYLQLGYSFVWDRDLMNQLMFVTRYDRVDLDRSIGSTDQRFWSLGGNLCFYNHFRGKLEYRFAREDGEHKDDDTFLGQLVFDF